MKQNWLKENVAEDKRNQLMWENNRNAGANGRGTQLIFDDIHTSDGYNDTDNDFGMQITLAVDVAPTKVVNKADATQEKIMSYDGRCASPAVDL